MFAHITFVPNKSHVLWKAIAPMGAVIFGSCLSAAQSPAQPNVKIEIFDQDPGWEGHNNRIVPERYPTVTQAFGYSRTSFAGKSLGEMGGRVTRASEPAYYADRLDPLTLNDALRASGTFALTQTTAGAGIFFGFFRAEQPGASGRPIGSLGMDFDCEQSGARLAVRLITAKNQSCGTFVTPFIPGKYRPTPIRADGTRYQWELAYDPTGSDDRGRFTFILHGAAPKPGELEKENLPIRNRQEIRSHFPDTTKFTVDLPAGYKQQGTTFDYFGLMNLMKTGGTPTIYFDDLAYAGRTQDFSRDPDWEAVGNRATYQIADVGALTISASAIRRMQVVNGAKSVVLSGVVANMLIMPTESDLSRSTTISKPAEK